MLNADVGSSTANSYLTLAEAESYFASRVGADGWHEASAETKERALLMAARALTRLRWPGRPADAAQALAWPRADVPWSVTEPIPPAIREAQCEEALAWLTPALVRRHLLRAAGVIRAGIAESSESYQPVSDATLLSAAARALVAGWVAQGGWIVDARAVEEGTWTIC